MPTQAAKKAKTTGEKTNVPLTPASAPKKTATPETDYFLYEKQLKLSDQQIAAYLVCKTINSEGETHYGKLALGKSQCAEIKDNLCLPQKYIDLLAKKPICHQDPDLPETYTFNQKEYPIPYICIPLKKHDQKHTDRPTEPIRYNPPSKCDSVAGEQARNEGGRGAPAPATPRTQISQSLKMAAVMLKNTLSDQFRLVFLMIDTNELKQQEYLEQQLSVPEKMIASSMCFTEAEIQEEIKERRQNPEKFWTHDLWQTKASAAADAKPLDEEDEEIVQVFLKKP